MIHECPRCRYKTPKAEYMIRHLKRKNKCKTKFENKSIDECLKMFEKGNYKCDCCENKYKYKSNLDKHVKNKNNENCSNDSSINNGNNNTINNSGDNIIDKSITQHIHIRPYNESNYDFLRDVIKECCNSRGKLNLNKLLSMAHFNEKHPENHNIYVSDARIKRVMVYDGETFEEKGRGSYGIEKFINNFSSKVDKNVDGNPGREYKSTYQYLPGGDKKIKRDNIFNTMYNGRKKVDKTHNSNDLLSFSDDEL